MALATLATLLAATIAAEAYGANARRKGGSDPLTFEQHVRPILKAHCFDCHGEGDKLRGGLDLRLTRSMARGGESGPAIVPGQPNASPLLRLVESGEMPKRDRKPSPQEIETLRRWIAQGARTARPEPESLPPGMQITAEEQSHWAFQPLRSPPIPRSRPNRRIRTPIDAFIATAFRPRRLSFADDAPPAVLARRLYLDLWGIPPTPEEVDEFVADRRPDAYERLVDRLLDSPRYGERWARHWLDVAGYADSDGYTNDDTVRPHAYKYRDYVIRALNRDLPFDRFLTEQLAGDELALQRHPNVESAAQDPETRDWLIATGYLRMAADGTASGGIDPEVARNQVMADTLKIVSTSLLGLSVGCAQCHDHRYDPIPQSDYFRLRAVFEPAYDWKAWRTPSERLVSLYTPADRQAAAAVESEAAAMAREKEIKQSQYLDEALQKHLREKFEEPIRTQLWTAYKTPVAQRTPAQAQLLRENPSANINPGVLYQFNPKAAEELKATDAKIAEIRKRKPVEDFVAVLTEPPGHRPTTFRFHRGDPKQPREPIEPGTLTVLRSNGTPPALPPVDTALPTSGRRLAFARWLTGTNNPILARVIVNRVWLHHFGRGLVGTPADFGLQGERPSHPELLEWLASTFVGPARTNSRSPGLAWSLKALHRLIVTSTTYRCASTPGSSRATEVDPENRLYTRHTLRRLDAEALRDGYLAVSGSLSDRRFGPPVPVREDVVGQVVVGIDKKEGDNKMPVEVPLGEDEFRRGIYIEVRRSKPLAFLNTFDAPVMEVNCERRASSTVAPQALMLMNSAFVLQQSGAFANRLRRDAGDDPARRIERAWRLAYGRLPTPGEHGEALLFLQQQTAAFSARTPSAAPASPPEDLAWRSLCQALLTSNEFLYLD